MNYSNMNYSNMNYSNMNYRGGNRYIFGPELGAGAFGTVYKAFDKWVNLNVCAIKRIAIGQTETTERIWKEVQSHNRLSHDNVVKFYNCYSFPTAIWIVMEYCDVGSLNAFLMKWIPSCNALVDFVQQVCCGVNHLHSQNVIHGDIKPDNIMMCTGLNGYILKIADFGLSRIWENFYYQLPYYNCTSPIKTPKYYSAPEVMKGKVTFKGDIFSLGCLVLAIFARTTIPWIKGKPLLAPYIGTPPQHLQISHVSEDHRESYIQGLPWSVVYAGLPELVISMVRQNWDERPTASEVLSSVIDIRLLQANFVLTSFYSPAYIDLSLPYAQITYGKWGDH